MLSSRKKSCYFKRNNIQEIDYKDVKLLTKFINDQGKITPRRVTGTSSKVILKEDVQNLGQQGDVVEVKSGYARNYLMPQKLAILFTKQQKKSIEEAQRVEERKLEREKDQLESVLKQVEDLSLSLKMQSEEDSKLFGSVTKLDIVKLLEENGITVDKKYVDLSSPIKTLGEHKVNIMFTKEMSASFTLTVEKED